MHERMQRLVNEVQQQYQLDKYFLKRYTIHHEKGVSYQSIYTLSMEWFPTNGEQMDEEDLNPDGTVAIEIDFHSKALRRLIFVNKVSHPNAKELFPAPAVKEVVDWIEKITHLTFETQFSLAKQTDHNFHFVAAAKHIEIAPLGVIQVEFNKENELTLFSIDGLFPTKNNVKQETFTLKKEKLESVFKQQLKLVEIPAEKEKRWVPVYGLDELYMRNKGKNMLDYPPTPKVRLHIPMTWTTTLPGPFERKEDVDLSTEVTIEQAIENKPHLDSYPITEVEKEAAISETRDFLCQEHPDESGKWNLHTLMRDHGYLIAEVQPEKEQIQVLPRKIKVIIDRRTLKAINYIDNKPMLDMFADYEAAEDIHVSSEEAFETLKTYMEVIPTYVYHPTDDTFYLYGKVDSDYGIHATTGEVINLNEL